jgi:tape measure domain-containing protein
MTFSVSLKLLTKNFQNGLKGIQGSLTKLRQQFSTFVGGIGIGMGIKELVENAKQLDKAQATLRNVSSSTEAYAENLKFVQNISKRYNQDLIILMGNFSKFHSAASYANMSLEDQYRIYESLTRASAYFNLTADETNGVMLAVQQMISKGKVSSEELRRQLGERLPGAMNLAAKAMGVTTAKLDEMIREGDVAATELLPKLAVELNALTQNLDVNTLSGLGNKLKNIFTGLVDDLNVKGMYRDFLQGASDAFEGLAKKLSAASKSIRTIVGWITDKFFFLANNITTILGTIGFHKLLSGASSAWSNFFGKIETRLKESQTKIRVYKTELEGLAKTSGVVYGTTPKGRMVVNPKNNTGVDPNAVVQAQAAARAYNTELRTSERLQGQLNSKWNTLKGAIGSVLSTMKMQALYMGISAALSLIITKTIQWFRNLNEIRRKTKEIKDDLQSDLNIVSPDQVTAESLLLKGNESYEKRLNLIREINKFLGLTGEHAFTHLNTDEEINKALKERIGYLEQSNELEAKKNALAKLQTQWNEKAGEGNTIEDLKKEKEELEKKVEPHKPGKYATREDWAYFGKNFKEEQKRINEIKQLIALDGEIKTLQKEVNDLLVSTGSAEELGPDPKTDEKTYADETLEEKYAKIKQEHNDKLRQLNSKLKDGIIKQEEYDKSLFELNSNTLDSIYLLNDINENADPFAKKLKDLVLSSEYLDEKQKKIKETLKEYDEKTKSLSTQLSMGVISQEDYIDAVIDLKSETAKALISMGYLSGATEELAAELLKMKKKQSNQKAADILAEGMPTLGTRDTFQDYKKKDSEKYEELAEIYDEYAKDVKALKEKIADVHESEPTQKTADMLEELNVLLERASQNAKTFSQAAQFAEVQEDVQSLKKELAEGIWDNISGVATAAERLTNSFKSLNDTMNDPDASGWEKLLTIFTTIISVV